MPPIPRLPANFGREVPLAHSAAAAPEVGSAERVSTGDRFETLPRHRSSDSALVRGGSWWSNFSASPAVRGVLMGAGGLASVFGGLAAPAVAAPVAVPAPQETAPIKNIVYVGMNEGASHEVRELRKRVGAEGVSFVQPGAEQDVITHNGVRYDLKERSEIESFVSSLGISGDRATELVDRMVSQTDKGRDELAQLVILLNQAENGERSIERLVFSGHSVGAGVWGDNNGSLKWGKLRGVMEVFPKAARQVEDVLLAACYSGGHRSMDTYRSLFPNLKTVWAYDGSAPGSHSGAVPHILRWERGTRGESTDRLDRDVAKHTRKGENVATWSISRGYDNGEELGPLATDVASYERTSRDVAAYSSGEQEQPSTQSGSLRDHYNNIQRLLGRQDVSDDMRSNLKTERDFTIRLIYFKNVKTYFQDVHSPTINTGFAEFGLNVPDFSTMSRKDVLSKIDEYNEKYDAADAASGGPSETATYLKDLLNSGLKNLRNNHVPEAWI